MEDDKKERFSITYPTQINIEPIYVNNKTTLTLWLIIDTITEQFEIMQSTDKNVMKIEN